MTVRIFRFVWRLSIWTGTFTDVEGRFGTGWTGYTWNKELFPSPKEFLSELHIRGYKVLLNVHPADGIRAYEDCYKDMENLWV